MKTDSPISKEPAMPVRSLACSAILRCEEYAARGWMLYIESFGEEWGVRIYDHDPRNPQAWGRGTTFADAVEAAEKELMATRRNFILSNAEVRDAADKKL